MTPPPNPFSPEAIAAHKERREKEQAGEDTQAGENTPRAVAVELHAGTPRDQVDALLADWINQSPETFSTGLRELAATVENYARSIKSSPESMGLEGSYHAYTVGKALEGAGKRLAESIKDRLISLADPEERALTTRQSFTSPSGYTFKIGPSPNPERAKVKELRAKFPDVAEELSQAGILYRSTPGRAVYLNRAGSKKTPNPRKKGGK